MRPFLDSANIAGDRARLAERMARDGYLYFRRLLPAEPIDNLRSELLAIAGQAGWLRQDRPPTEAIADPGAACADPEENFVAVLARFYRLEALHALKHHPALFGVFESLLGDEVFVHPLVIPRAVFPARDDLTTPPHQDYVHIQGTPETYTAWVPLSDCPKSMGPLAVAKGSHTAGVRDFDVSTGAGAIAVTDPLHGQWHCNDFVVGDVLIFHSMTVHRGLPNKSDKLRQSLDMRYQRASDPVAEVSLSPYAGTGTWDEIYANWPHNGLKYYWRDVGLQIAPFDRRYYDDRDRKAFAMARRGDTAARPSLLRIMQRDPDPAKRQTATELMRALESEDRRL